MLAPVCVDAARQSLERLGIRTFTRQRLSQLYHALDHAHSVWFHYSNAVKQDIRNDVMVVLDGRVDPLVTSACKAKRKSTKLAKALPDTTFEQVTDVRLRKILKERIPHKPYCCDDFALNAPRCLSHALKKRYIQLSPPGWSSFIIVDCDYPDAGNAWKKAGLSPPTWVAVNHENGHAHLVWAIFKPVWAGGNNKGPARYFLAVQEGFRKVLRGDEGFVHLLTKNPIHPAWITISDSSFAAYELSDLAKHVKLERPRKKHDRDGASIGRNCLVFDELRYWAYSAVRRFDDPINFSMAVQAHVEKLNGVIANPMDAGEVLHIARSVSKWVWQRLANNGFSERQKERGRLGGKAKGAANADKRSTAIRMSKEGHSVREIALALSVGKSSVQRWLPG